LPPVSQATAKIQIKPGSNTLVTSKVKNIPIANPLVVTRSLGKQRAFAILAGDIWKWQLQTAEKYPEFFDNFINDIVKWLNLSSLQKQFSISTDKKYTRQTRKLVLPRSYMIKHSHRLTLHKLNYKFQKVKRNSI